MTEKLVEISPDTETFQPDLEELERKITANTRAVIVNSPHNPTGVIYSEDTIKLWQPFLRKSRRNMAV